MERVTQSEIQELRRKVQENADEFGLLAFDRLAEEVDMVHRDLHELEVEHQELMVHKLAADESGFPVERAIRAAEALRIVLEAIRTMGTVGPQVLEFATQTLGEYDLRVDTNLPE